MTKEQPPQDSPLKSDKLDKLASFGRSSTFKNRVEHEYVIEKSLIVENRMEVELTCEFRLANN